MSANSKIEWTDHTFNPWEGCQKVGPGCDHCYAETRNARFNGGQPINWGPGAPRRRTSVSNWSLPKRWNDQHEAFFAQHGRRQRVFCASLADVFDNAVPLEWRDELFTLIRATPHLDWLLLTKRIGNVAAMVSIIPGWLPANVRIGATIVNQAEADRDIPKLLALPCPNFLSMEPLLGPISFEGFFANPANPADGTNALEDIHWVIVGGESGPGARPMNPDWARSLRDQCEAVGTPFLFKQWGEWAPPATRDDLRSLGDMMRAGKAIHIYGDGREPDGHFRKGDEHLLHVGKKAAGRLLDGRTWDGVPA
ncbi:phage Gp37/Gp68 family protein [Variovorax sp. PAMC26660]|uniref:phage Gp37/Gp68 family protein n=1 Tax=Variovorax sp. PAMC26660 TaxID=2762322 RepID=UPI00164D2A7B|nr:phage Gp37/Gp68 family protein [Variovorax sp. PAMC26660]QNK66060.1 phage Gp37/Gp68 family protein [Variovorax sp. PAMC26660]